MKTKVYLIDVSQLLPEEKGILRKRLSDWCFMVNDRYESNTWAAFLAFWDHDEDFKSVMKIPPECTVTDVTGWDLTKL